MNQMSPVSVQSAQAMQPVPITNDSLSDLSPLNLSVMAICQTLIPQGLAAGIAHSVSYNRREAVAVPLMLPFKIPTASGAIVAHVAEGRQSILTPGGSRVHVSFRIEDGHLYYYRHDD